MVKPKAGSTRGCRRQASATMWRWLFRTTFARAIAEQQRTGRRSWQTKALVVATVAFGVLLLAAVLWALATGQGA